MHNVRSPEEPASVAGAVEPIIAEVVSEERQHPCPPLIADRKDSKLVHPGENGEDHSLGQQTNHDVADAHREAGGRVFGLVKIAAHPGVRDSFHHQ